MAAAAWHRRQHQLPCWQARSLGRRYGGAAGSAVASGSSLQPLGTPMLVPQGLNPLLQHLWCSMPVTPIFPGGFSTSAW